MTDKEELSRGDALARVAVLEAELADHERLQAETERLQADHEAAIAELQADRDQQYDMKVKAREQRDVVTAENQRLRKALTRHVCTGMTDAQRTAELERYLSDGIAADKARIKLLEEQRDAFTMHKLASRQCIGIPASVGVCEPVEGFAERPQDLAPAMREMALIIEADKARIEGLTDLCDRLKQEAQIQAQEARTANATIAEIYQIVTGKTGEPGNWNGAEPVRRRIAELEQDKARLDSGCIMTNERDEFGHEYQCERRGLNLRERIDAALARQGKDGE